MPFINLSSRRDKPFIAINCAALPDQLLESELFGHEAQAFTGATKRKEGLIEVAEDGTLFLDEIASMKPDLQAKAFKGNRGKSYSQSRRHHLDQNGREIDLRIES